MLPATVGASIYQLSIFCATVLASLLQEGSVSWLFYADRVAQFPIGVFSVALASVLLPTLSNASATADGDKFRTSLGNSLRYTSFCVLPMAAGIWALSLPITQMLFERGNFSYESSVRTSQALQALALGLWFSSCHSMIVRAFIAKKDTTTPTLIGVASLVTNLTVSLALMGPISASAPGRMAEWLRLLQDSLLHVLPALPALGHVGLALASSIAAVVSLLLAATILSLREQQVPWGSVLPATMRALVASTLMVIAISWATAYTTTPFTACSWGIATGMAVYAISNIVLRSPEMRETLSVAQRFTSRR
jgi:putative peptidoglycan lipid II flippase